MFQFQRTKLGTIVAGCDERVESCWCCLSERARCNLILLLLDECPGCVRTLGWNGMEQVYDMKSTVLVMHINFRIRDGVDME